MTIILVKLLLAHILTDFIFQTDNLVVQKRQNRISPIIHSVIAGLLAYLLVAQWSCHEIFWVTAISHYIIDFWKINQKKDNFKLFLIDQGLHGLVILLLSIWLIKDISEINLNVFSEKNLLYLTAFITVTKPYSVIIQKFTQKWQSEAHKEAGSDNLEKAGEYIGIFERILVLLFVIFQQYPAIGFLITAKSILRFSSNNKEPRKQTEYILIGTFLSFTLTIITGLLLNHLIGQIRIP